jgi:hypothetical protein
MKNIIELLAYIKDNNFEGMLKYIPEGITHRASKYNTSDSFELEGSYEEDARYGYPAREMMKEACLEYCIKELDNLYVYFLILLLLVSNSRLYSGNKILFKY